MDDKFGRYLLGELLWELTKFEIAVPGLTDVLPDNVEVLGFSGYDIVRVRTATKVINAYLNWKADPAPVLKEVTDEDA